MPPKLGPERIQEKLVELRAFVTLHADVMRSRSGASVLEKLRQKVSKEEKGWHNFLTNNIRRRSFTAAHDEHLAATHNLINDTVASGAASTGANPASQISTQTSVVSNADDS